jgi:hypothetical protein
MYVDPIGHQGTKKLRRSEMGPIPAKSRCTRWNTNLCSANGNKLHGSINLAAVEESVEAQEKPWANAPGTQETLTPYTTENLKVLS